VKITISTQILKIQTIPGRGNFYLIETPYEVCWEESDGTTGTVKIPLNFCTDFASVPRPFWGVVDPLDYDIRLIAPAHDRLYETHEQSRAFADRLLYFGMLASGASMARAWAVWSAVRIGGASAYDSGPERKQGRIVTLITHELCKKH